MWWLSTQLEAQNWIYCVHSFFSNGSQLMRSIPGMRPTDNGFTFKNGRRNGLTQRGGECDVRNQEVHFSLKVIRVNRNDAAEPDHLLTWNSFHLWQRNFKNAENFSKTPFIQTYQCIFMSSKISEMQVNVIYTVEHRLIKSFCF